MKYNIFILGDSITHATGDINNEIIGWAERFKLLYMKENNNNNKFYVNYLGFSGWTTHDVVDDVIHSFCDIIKNPNFDDSNRIIIIELGTNDVQSNCEGKTKVSIDEFEKNINKMILEIRKCTKNILFLGLTRAQTEENIPFYWSENKYYDNRTLNKYDEKLKKICEKEKIEYLPIDKIMRENGYKDGLHPSNKGHEALSMAVFEKIHELFID